MDRFKNILVAASPGWVDATVVRAAVELATENDATLTLIDVVAPLPRWKRKANIEGRVIDVEGALIDERRQQLRGLIENAGGASDIEVDVLVGEPFIEVVRRVLSHGHDLVILAEPSRAGTLAPRPSSGVMHVLRKCPAPVWVMHPSRSEKSSILALVDPDPEDGVRNDLNDLVLELAASLARRNSSELHIGHAWVFEGERTLATSPFVEVSGSTLNIMITDTEHEHAAMLERLLADHDLDDLDTSVHMVHGTPGIELPRLAEEIGIGLIVMGTVGRTGIQGLIMGNTAETILRCVHCSVLAVKPEGFVSPVKGRRRSR
jgi:nucleotide-binding universal stress UspA family protein